MLGEVIGKIMNDILKKEYRGLVPFFIFINSMISPMILFLYVYDFETFRDLDFLKILLLVISVNSIVVIFSFLISNFMTLTLVISREKQERDIEEQEEINKSLINRINKLKEVNDEKDNSSILLNSDNKKQTNESSTSIEKEEDEGDDEELKAIEISVHKITDKLIDIKQKSYEINEDIFRLQVTFSFFTPVVISALIIFPNIEYLFGIKNSPIEPYIIFIWIDLALIIYIVSSIYYDFKTDIGKKNKLVFLFWKSCIIFYLITIIVNYIN